MFEFHWIDQSQEKKLRGVEDKRVDKYLIRLQVGWSFFSENIFSSVERLPKKNYKFLLGFISKDYYILLKRG